MALVASTLALGWTTAMSQTLEDAYAALYGERGRDAVAVAERWHERLAGRSAFA